MAITQDGSTSQHLQAGQQLAQRLDNDFLLANQVVHHNTNLVIPYMDYYHEDIILISSLLAPRHAQYLVQAGNRDNLSPDDDNLLVLDSLDVIRRNIDGAVNGAKRNSVHLILHLHQHSLDDSQGERQLDLEYGALVYLGLHIHMSPQGLDLAAHHVHAYAAS